MSNAARATMNAGQLDSQATGRSMGSAAAAFDRANSWVSSPLGRARALVPLVGQQVRAVEVASASGADLGRAGADLADAVEEDALRIVDGRIPLERLQDAQPKAARAAAAIASARSALGGKRSPWLVPQLSSRLDRVQVQLATAGDQADRAAALLDEIPLLLGSQGPRRYFVAVQTPSELRGSGGFMGSFAEIAVDDGRMVLARTGRTTELNQDRSTPMRSLDAPADFLERYAGFEVATTWQSVTISPHFPSNAQVIRSLYPQSGGRPVIQALRKAYDTVILDCPPLLPVTDSLILAAYSDATLLVVSEGKTSRRSLARALELLRQVNAPLRGTVLNATKGAGGYGYGYAYGQPKPPSGGDRPRWRRRGRQPAVPADKARVLAER